MRKISYICNRCGADLRPCMAIKINVSIQRGNNPVDKTSFDFCSKCFLSAKTGFLNGMRPDDTDDPSTTNELVSDDTKTQGSDVKAEKPDRKTSVPGQNHTISLPNNVHSADASKIRRESDKEGLITGSMSAEEKNEILRLYVEENLSPEQIAVRINRLPRGVKRTINTAERTGELAKRKEAFKVKMNPDSIITDPNNEKEEYHVGSGVSNSGILRDSYVAMPKIETLNGIRYDVGSILAFAKAGWPADKIAEERHYDEDAVRTIMEKYGYVHKK